MSSRWWPAISLAATGVLVAAALVVWTTGVSAPELSVFHAIVNAFDRDSAFFHWCTRLGSGRVVMIAGLFFLVLLPGPSLRRWWLWLGVVLAVSMLEGWGKDLIGRPRPEAARAGFPSGHTALAAAFYPMVAYVATYWLRSRLARIAAHAAAAAVVVLVGVSRMVRWQHWPLDVVGGAALGVAVFAAAAWCYERYPARDGAALLPLAGTLGRWAHRHGAIIPVPFFAVVLFTAPLGVGNPRLDVACDVVGGACIVAALWLHLWTRHHARRHGPMPTSGPYAYMRHPRLVVHLLVALGLAVLAESGIGLVLIPAVLVTMYRAGAHVEEVELARRFGAAWVEHYERLPLVPWPTFRLLRAAVSAEPWQELARERRFVLATLLLAALADLSDRIPRLF